MREIKFRYWCKIEAKMYDKAYVNEHLNLAFMSELIESAQERYIFLQYTGLKDKNGKEIYEDDVFTKESGSRFRVYYSKESACYRAERIKDGWHFDLNQLYPINDWEVIGNIYENPELVV